MIKSLNIGKNKIFKNILIAFFITSLVLSCSASQISILPASSLASTAPASGFIRPSPSAYTPLFPLKVSTNNRYLVDQNNVPFFISGDAAWSLIVQLTNEDAVTYLSNRQEHGFNAILTELIEHYFSTNAPNNIYNDAPFTGAAFITPNEKYFAHADDVIQQAALHNIVVFLAPLYLGYAGTEEGWDSEIASATIDDMRKWGEYVGNRYKDFPNIVWVVGGDQDPTALLPKINAFTEALIDKDRNHLVTFHDVRNTTARDHLEGATWLTLNNIYTTYLGTAEKAQSAYGSTPTLPLFQIEGYYENDHSMTTQKLRAQAYWTLLSGGSGYVFGNTPLWYFDFEGADWKSAMDAPGSVSMSYAAALFGSLPWERLVPDINHEVGTAGYGDIGTDNYITTSWIPDGSEVMAYFPSKMTLTIDMSKLKGNVEAKWYDPTNGTYSVVNGSPFPNIGLHEFTPPGNNANGDPDWILLLKAIPPQNLINHFLPGIKK